MKIYRCILAKWVDDTSLSKVLEGQFTDEKIIELNNKGYNIYYLPNYPKEYNNSEIVDGSMINTFEWCFVDMDLKDGVYNTPEAFIETLHRDPLLIPTKIIDSGNGIHAYWRVSDLDALTYLKIQKRLVALFNTDPAVGQIYQLMRHAPSINVKNKTKFKEASILFETDKVYTSEYMDKVLPKLSHADAKYCEGHYNKTYKLEVLEEIVENLPPRFIKLLADNNKVKDIWSGEYPDRSKADYHLAHLMLAAGFKRGEALSVLVNTPKARERAPVHRISYATNIADKIWVEAPKTKKKSLSVSVGDVLKDKGANLKGTRFYCHSYLDNTENGFRLGQIIGLVAGSGVGKTALALNMFKGFVQNNSEYHHFFIPLEQPVNEIAERWRTMCGKNTSMHEKVHLISNYDEDGTFRHLSLNEIKEYILEWQTETGNKVGAVVIDHIGALKKKGSSGENQDLMSICHEMKAFTVETNTMLIMQSQAPREKAGIGDLELNKDAAYGTVYFESYCDYLMTLWQPLKRCYAEDGCPTVMAIKFCKIRHKKQHKDVIKEDVCYKLMFDPETEQLRQLSSQEEKGFTFWNQKATNKRKLDRKTDLVDYKSMDFSKMEAS